MRLRTLAISAAVLLPAAPAFAQGNYSPPPVVYAGSGGASSAPSPAVTSSGVSYSPPPVVEADPDQEQASERRDRRSARGGRSRGGRGGDRPRIDVGAYLGVDQVVSAELSGGGNNDTLTYTSVTAGVQGQVETRRVQASFGAQYERRIDWNGEVANQDTISGIAQVHADVVPGGLAMDAGALATRTGGNGNALGVSDRQAAQQVYAGYVGPSATTHVGPVAVTAAYRLGYAHVEDDGLAGFNSTTGSFDSTVHSFSASAGMAPGGDAPIGWTVGGGYMREDSGDLENRFSNAFVRADVVVPISPTFAVTGGVGYARTRASQQDVLRDGTGFPVLDARGNLIANPAAARIQTYDSEGIYYDAGFLWRPSPRSEIQVRAGADQDGNFTVVGSAGTQIGRSAGASISVFDQRQSYGQNMVNTLRNLPTQFNATANPISGLFGGCVFGETPGQGTCLAPALQSLTTQSFRARGAQAILSGGQRLWTWGVGATYTRRDFFRPEDPQLGSIFSDWDEDVSLFANATRRLSRQSFVSFDLYASRYTASLPGSRTNSAGGTISYSRTFLFDRLQFLASLGLTHVSADMTDSDVINALIGLRYTF